MGQAAYVGWEVTGRAVVGLGVKLSPPAFVCDTVGGGGVGGAAELHILGDKKAFSI